MFNEFARDFASVCSSGERPNCTEEKIVRGYGQPFLERVAFGGVELLIL